MGRRKQSNCNGQLLRASTIFPSDVMRIRRFALLQQGKTIQPARGWRLSASLIHFFSLLCAMAQFRFRRLTVCIYSHFAFRPYRPWRKDMSINRPCYGGSKYPLSSYFTHPQSIALFWGTNLPLVEWFVEHTTVDSLQTVNAAQDDQTSPKKKETEQKT